MFGYYLRARFIIYFLTRIKIMGINNKPDSPYSMQQGAINNSGSTTYRQTLKMIEENCKTLRFVSDDFPELLDKCRELYVKNSKMLDEHARDMLLLSCITALSICFPTVRLPYGTSRYSINISMLFGAPSSSNKSVMKYASLLLNALNKYLGDQYKEELREWQHQCERWEQEKKMAAKEKRNINFDLEPGDKPLLAIIRIPVNSPKSMWIDLIKGNERYGNLADTTELDSLSDANSKECGNMMDLINKAAMNEPIDKAFRIDGTVVNISFPMLSLMGSGTLNQLHRIIVSYETGLGSRMPVYLGPDLAEFLSQKPSDNAVDFNKYYNNLGEEVLLMWKFFASFNFIVTFSDEQWDKHTEQWKECFDEVRMTRREMVSVSTRFGLFHMRIASVLTMLRLWDQVKGDIEVNRSVYAMGNEHNIQCNDNDFEMAGMIASTIFEHTMTFSTSKVQQIDTNVKAMENWHWQFEVLKLMPETFTSDDFKAIATKQPFGKSASQCYNVLQKMSKGKGKVVKKLKARVNGHIVFQKMADGKK